MNCQEVMEYMQRQLDLDLSDAERELLDSHVKNCISCQTMLERLQRLTSELSNLPKVHPPVSLVDAIMPRLEEIDRARSPQAGASAPLRSDARTARANKRKRLYQTAVGIVAASVLLGVAIMNFNSDGLQRAADHSSELSGAYASELASAMTNSASDVVSQDEVKDDQLMQYSDGEMSNALSIRAAGADEDSAEQIPNSSLTDAGELKADEEASVRGLTSRSGSAISPDVEVKESELAFGLTVESYHVIDQSSRAEGGVLSPDGDYLAAIEGDAVVIYDASGELIYYFKDFAGAELSDLVWVSESRLTFWIKIDGSEQSHYIDLAERVEGEL